jgi:hypothetical protein
MSLIFDKNPRTNQFVFLHRDIWHRLHFSIPASGSPRRGNLKNLNGVNFHGIDDLRMRIRQKIRSIGSEVFR